MVDGRAGGVGGVVGEEWKQTRGGAPMISNWNRIQPIVYGWNAFDAISI